MRVCRKNGSEITAELSDFAKAIGLESLCASRYSLLILLEIFALNEEGIINPFKVIDQIKNLEGVGGGTGLKRATPFNHYPLKGLWHQHYLEAGLPAIATNIKKGINKFGLPWLERKVVDAKVSGEERFFTEADVLHIAHDAVISNWERLISNQALTGEWLIFARINNENYYLCLAKHNDGDVAIRAKIDAVCLKEFPFLSDVLSA